MTFEGDLRQIGFFDAASKQNSSQFTRVIMHQDAHDLEMNDATMTLILNGTESATQKIIKSNVIAVDPESSGATENLLLPPEGLCSGLVLYITNKGGEGVAVQNDAAGAILTIDTTETGVLVCDGTTWRGFIGEQTEGITIDNIGTVGTGVTAVEHGDAFRHTTVLTLTGVAITIGDNVSLADGALIYTLPAGTEIIESTYFSLGLTLTTGTPTTDTPEIGLGTVIGSGANATLGAVAAGAEDIAGPAVMDDVAGTAELLTSEPGTVPSGFVVTAAGVHLIHANVADAWADVTDAAATLAGTVVINWRFFA